jgi:G3E family GTPase
VQLVAVSGTQGSGKTTLIREVIARLTSRGNRCGVIVNEDGQAKYDDDFLGAHHVAMKTLRGG